MDVVDVKLFLLGFVPTLLVLLVLKVLFPPGATDE